MYGHKSAGAHVANICPILRVTGWTFPTDFSCTISLSGFQSLMLLYPRSLQLPSSLQHTALDVCRPRSCCQSLYILHGIPQSQTPHTLQTSSVPFKPAILTVPTRPATIEASTRSGRPAPSSPASYAFAARFVVHWGAPLHLGKKNTQKIHKSALGRTPYTWAKKTHHRSASGGVNRTAGQEECRPQCGLYAAVQVRGTPQCRGYAQSGGFRLNTLLQRSIYSACNTHY